MTVFVDYSGNLADMADYATHKLFLKQLLVMVPSGFPIYQVFKVWHQITLEREKLKLRSYSDVYCDVIFYCEKKSL